MWYQLLNPLHSWQPCTIYIVHCFTHELLICQCFFLHDTKYISVYIHNQWMPHFPPSTFPPFHISTTAHQLLNYGEFCMEPLSDLSMGRFAVNNQLIGSCWLELLEIALKLESELQNLKNRWKHARLQNAAQGSSSTTSCWACRSSVWLPPSSSTSSSAQRFFR